MWRTSGATMVFWGTEVKPGVPYFHKGPDHYEGCRLHLSRATLGLDAKGKERTVIKCKVGEGAELLLCSLTAGVLESCSLDLLFDRDVVFSVTGPSSVHLVGYYMPLDDEEADADYAMESTDSEEESDSDFEVDDSDGCDALPPSSVRIAEVDDDGNPLELVGPETGGLEKIFSIVQETIQEPENGGNLKLCFPASYTGQGSFEDDESDDEGYLPASPVYVPNEQDVEHDDVYRPSSPSAGVPELGNNVLVPEIREKNTVISVVREGTTTVTEVREEITKVTESREKNTKVPPVPEEGVKVSKKRKKQATKKAKENGTLQVVNGSLQMVNAEMSEDEDGFPLPSKGQQSASGVNGAVEPVIERSLGKRKKEKLEKEKAKEEEKAKEKKKKEIEKKDKKEKKKLKKQKSIVGADGAETAEAELAEGIKPTENGTKIESAPVSQSSEKKKGKKAKLGVRTYPNGLEVADIALGKPDAKQTKGGKSVSVYYTGKIKSSGKIFDSNIGRTPFKFRLGVGEVIKGWDVGVTGMRVGDKRRITIPPAMAYGPRGVPGRIPGNSWLVFDVELVNAGG